MLARNDRNIFIFNDIMCNVNKTKIGVGEMDWITSIRKSIDYMEDNILTVKSADEVAAAVHMSSYYLQKGFKVMTGYTIKEYIRNRRLYMAALDIMAEKEKLIDVAFKYGYDTPESFTKAFSRFHGAVPSKIKYDGRKIKVFLPLKITINIKGGNDMDFVVEKLSGFKVIGYEKEFSFDNAYQDIPVFWDKVFKDKMGPLYSKQKPDNKEEEIICNCCIGKYGVNIDDIGNNMFRYIIAGDYTGGEVPEGMTVYEFPDMEWAKFSCKGPMPGSMQSVNSNIFKEWLPNNPDYEIAMGASIELYSKPTDTISTSDDDYESEIWIPVKKK